MSESKPDMRFQVHSVYSCPDIDEMGAKDAAIVAAAGRSTHYGGMGCVPEMGCARDNGWMVDTFDEARAIKQRLDALGWVKTTISER